MQTALIHDFHYSAKESDYWFELLLLICYSLKIPPLRNRMGNLKIALVWETAHFYPSKRFKLTVILQHKGALELQVRLSASRLLLLQFSPLHDNSIIPRMPRLQMPQDRLGPAMNCFPWARLSDFVQLFKGRGTMENWTSADGHLFDVNRAKKLQIIWVFPGFLSHLSYPISKHSTRETSSQASRVIQSTVCFFAGISAGPFAELYMEASTSGICC